MSYSIEINVDACVAHESWTGPVTLEDILAGIEKRLAHPDYCERMSRIIDLSNARVRLSGDEIQVVAELLRARPYTGRCAIVAPSHLEYGSARVYEALTDQIRAIRVFRSADDARRWIQEPTPVG
jgi:hypothetical protein